MSDKAEGNSFQGAEKFVGGIFANIAQAWSAPDTGAAANNAYSAMSNPTGGANSIAQNFDPPGNPFTVSG